MLAPLRLVLFILVCPLLAAGLHVLQAAEPRGTAQVAESTDTSTFPPELVQLVPSDRNPLFTGGAAGAWDVALRERGWIARQDDRWQMWYTGYDGTREGLKMLGHATSDDGLNWVRDPRNPLVRNLWVEDVMVVRQGDTYYMFAEGRNDQAQLLSSSDGVEWNRRGPLDIRYVDGRPLSAGPYGTPTAWFEDGVWYLFYERMDAGVWLARSTDMKVWTHVQDEPVLSPGPDRYDGLMIALNQVIRHEGRYYASYHGSGDRERPRQWCSCVAVSDDLRKWQKYPGNPIVADNKSSGIWIDDGRGYRFYTMHDQVDLYLPRRD